MISLSADTAWMFISACLAGDDPTDHQVAVAVVDSGGHLLAFRRHEAIGHFYVELSQAKARAAAALRRSPKAAFEHWRNHPGLMSAVSQLDPAGIMLPSPGAFVVRGNAGECIGGIGIAGPATGAHAEALGLRVGAALGLKLEA